MNYNINFNYNSKFHSYPKFIKEIYKEPLKNDLDLSNESIYSVSTSFSLPPQAENMLSNSTTFLSFEEIKAQPAKKKNKPYLKRRARATLEKVDNFCRKCKIKETSQWRRGPDGKNSLCNACGIKFQKVLKAEDSFYPGDKATVSSRMKIQEILNPFPCDQTISPLITREWI